MTMPSAPREPSPDELDELAISPLAIINMILRHRRLLVLGPVLGFAVGVLLTLGHTRVYEAAVQFVSSPGGDKGVTGVGGDMGPAQQKDPYDYYATLLKSTAVVDAVLETPLDGGKLADSLAIPDDALLTAPERARRRLADAEVRLDSSSKARSTGALEVLRIHARWTEPATAAAIANAFVDALAGHDQKIRSSAARARREFIDQQITDTGKALRAAEDALRIFKQQNRLLALAETQTADNPMSVPPELLQRKDQLQREVNVQGELYLTLKKGFEQARIAEMDDASALVIIERAAAPRIPIGSGRRTTVILAGMLGLMIAAGIAGLRELRSRVDLTTPEGQELVGHLSTMNEELHAVRQRLAWPVAPDADTRATRTVEVPSHEHPVSPRP
jgi:uncharacterized protein involved in exopolysaccharide biosynthesis